MNASRGRGFSHRMHGLKRVEWRARSAGSVVVRPSPRTGDVGETDARSVAMAALCPQWATSGRRTSRRLYPVATADGGGPGVTAPPASSREHDRRTRHPGHVVAAESDLALLAGWAAHSAPKAFDATAQESAGEQTEFVRHAFQPVFAPGYCSLKAPGRLDSVIAHECAGALARQHDSVLACIDIEAASAAVSRHGPRSASIHTGGSASLPTQENRTRSPP